MENHKFMNDHEDSMITKSFILASFNSYTGLFANAFYARSFGATAMLLITILIFKQIILNIKEAMEPHQVFPKKFREHKQNFVNHCRKYSDSYDEFKERAVHEEAEVQLLMQSMPPMNVGAYNEIII